MCSIHILSDKDLLQLFKDVVQSKAPALAEEQGKSSPSPLTNLTKNFKPDLDAPTSKPEPELQSRFFAFTQKSVPFFWQMRK